MEEIVTIGERASISIISFIFSFHIFKSDSAGVMSEFLGVRAEGEKKVELKRTILICF